MVSSSPFEEKTRSDADDELTRFVFTEVLSRTDALEDTNFSDGLHPVVLID